MSKKDIASFQQNFRIQGIKSKYFLIVSVIKSLILSIACIIVLGQFILIVSLSVHSIFSVILYQIGMLISVIDFILFIVSVEIYSTAIRYNILNFSQEHLNSLKKEYAAKNIDWDDFLDYQRTIYQKRSKQANIIYDIALILFFLALFFMLPYPGINIIMLVAGIVSISWVLIKKH